MTNRQPVARESANIIDEQEQKLRQLFPEVFSEDKVDFAKLRTTLGDLVDERLPELTEVSSPAQVAGYNTISEVGKERMRLVIEGMETRDEGKFDFIEESSEDLGFKVFKLDSSNMRLWTGVKEIDPAEYFRQMALFTICLDNRVSPDPSYTLGLSKTDLFICRDVALDDTLAANIALNCRLKTI